nr:hypothetical protein Itr_chr03CG12260 [Ipomoea trifida]
MKQNTLQIKMKQERRKIYLPQCRERDTLDSSQQICSYLQSQCMDNGQQKTYAEGRRKQNHFIEGFWRLNNDDKLQPMNKPINETTWGLIRMPGF